jgi:uncharacterized membrane protein YphA (DoxX/SURF4 family)
MKIVELIVRLLLGLVFLVFGLNAFLQFLNVPHAQRRRICTRRGLPMPRVPGLNRAARMVAQRSCAGAIGRTTPLHR